MKDVFVNASIMNTQLNLNVERVKNLYMPFAATIAEQEKIANHLDHKCTQIDKLIALKQQKIEKLQQYKKSLIYEYVTGKKEV
jgi:type I restriction enzyme S subunit